jgi:hypothetical protein
MALPHPYLIKEDSCNSVSIAFDLTHPTTVVMAIYERVNAAWVVTPITKAGNFDVTTYLTDTAGTTVTLSTVANLVATYIMTLPGNKVYKFEFTTGGVKYIHLYVSTCALETCFSDKLKDVICCCPEKNCKNSATCSDLYDMIVLGLLSATYFGYAYDPDIERNTTITDQDLLDRIDYITEAILTVARYCSCTTNTSCGCL